MATAFRQIGGTLKRIVQVDRKVFFFLLAFFLYIDGVGTIIDNCINIGTDLGLNTVGQVLVLLATQVVAWVFSLVFARLSPFAPIKEPEPSSRSVPWAEPPSNSTPSTFPT